MTEERKKIVGLYDVFEGETMFEASNRRQAAADAEASRLAEEARAQRDAETAARKAAATDRFVSNVVLQHSIAASLAAHPGLRELVETDTERAVAHAALHGFDVDALGYKKLRRSLAIAKELVDPTARASVWLDAHYLMQRAIADQFRLVDDSPWPTRNEYLHDRIRLLDATDDQPTTSKKES